MEQLPSHNGIEFRRCGGMVYTNVKNIVLHKSTKLPEASEGRKKWGVKICDIHVSIQKNCAEDVKRRKIENYSLFDRIS